MILEGIVTTIDGEGAVNVAPMGPRTTKEMGMLVLRPFQTSRTYANLRERGEGVFHITDDVELIAHAAVERVEPRLKAADRVRGFVLEDACRAYEFRVVRMDDRDERATFEAEVVHVHRFRDFLGYCRARNAVLEAAILATRVGILPTSEIRSRFSELRILVEKTGGVEEHRAFDFLSEWLERSAEIPSRSVSP